MKLTKSQRRVLEWLRKNKNEADGAITCEGLECWIGDERTNWALVNRLLRLVLLRDMSDSSLKRYIINECGERALDGLPPYRDSDGNWYCDYDLLVASQPRIKYGD